MQEWLTTEEGPLELHGVKVKVGDRAIISRPASMDRYAERIERLSTVTAARLSRSTLEGFASATTEESGADIIVLN